MIHQAYEQTETNRLQPRERRFVCPGVVRILCGLPPFQLLLSLPLVNLSQTGLAVRLERTSPLAQQAPMLLEPGDPFDLQVEPEAEEYPTVQISSELVRVQPMPNCWLLGFAFDDTNPDLLGLVHELQLVAPTDQPGTPSHPYQ